ncbi:diguanylate cyclase domain-containing protein [Paenibacillus sp. MBLB4367]|uniref:diguanylate cyclase domain-containing protein n=1 Tax=Paenibacillus sp. MBLB4367 TaxID=3384767 RepID=UPI00390815DB
MIAHHYEEKIELVSLERSGMRFHHELNRLSGDLRSYRSYRIQATGQQTESNVLLKQKQITDSIQSIIDENHKLGDPFFASPFLKALSDEWVQIQNMGESDVQRERSERMNSLLSDINKLMLIVADNSGIRSDHNSITSFLAQALIDRLVPMIGQIDRAARTAGMTADLSVSSATTELRGQIRMQVKSILESHEFIKRSMEHPDAVSTGYRQVLETEYKRFRTDTEALLELLKSDILASGNASANAEQAIGDQSFRAMASGNDFYDAISVLLDKRLSKQIHDEGLKKILALLVMGAAVAVMVLLFIGFYISVVHAVFALRRTSLEVASGHMWSRINLGTDDELKEVETAYNRMAEAYGDIMRKQEAIEGHLQRRAYYDALTGAPNRFLFHERLGEAIAGAEKQQVMLGLLLIDLDGFKKINETSGHRIGDLLLQQVAERLTECLRETDTVARVDGDEFSVILPELPGRHAASHVADKLLRGFLTPFAVEGVNLTVSASIGISLYPDDGDEADSLMSKADMAMYSVKEQGKNGYRFYESKD